MKKKAIKTAKQERGREVPRKPSLRDAALKSTFQIALAQNFARTKSFCYIPLEREFNSAFIGLCPLSKREKKVDENSGKLKVTL